MIIRKAQATDAQDLKVLYFEYLTHFPPKEEQNMKQWEEMLEKYEKDDVGSRSGRESSIHSANGNC